MSVAELFCCFSFVVIKVINFSYQETNFEADDENLRLG